jgi:hypothetical protein
MAAPGPPGGGPPAIPGPFLAAFAASSPNQPRKLNHRNNGFNPPTFLQRALAPLHNGVPPINSVFAAGLINPRTNLDMQISLQACLNIIQRILDPANNIDSKKVHQNKFIKSGTLRYQNTMHVGMVTKAILGCCFGYEQAFGTEEASLNAYVKNMNDNNNVVNIMHWNLFVQPTIDYIFNFIIPREFVNIKKEAIMECKINNWEIHLKRGSQQGGRCDSSVWSNEYFTAPGRRMTRRDSDICNGHFLGYVLICDSMVPGFLEKLTNGTAYVSPTQDFDRICQLNQVNRLYLD